MASYYAVKLSGERLRQCYEIASPRVKQYLSEEIQFLQARLRPTDAVLELGCGYGRVALPLAEVARRVVGIDTSAESLDLARKIAGPGIPCEFLQMDALELAFPDYEFDVVVCVQNGICAFGVDQEHLIREAVRVTRPGGLVLFSTYSESFWPHRLRWFESQAEAGLVGEIDYDATGDGTIVCRDGFRAGILEPGELQALCTRAGLVAQITEVNGSSVFCEITVPSIV